jgi:hypothetical protein
MYGGLFVFPDQLAASGFEQPFMVTEWGTIGYWETNTTNWGAPVELHSSDKADTFIRAHRDILEPLQGQLLGSYAFYWGQKQERTPTWFGMLTENGDLTEAVHAMQYVWTGKWPETRAPRVTAVLLDGKSAGQSVKLVADQDYEAVIDVRDADDRVTYRWELKPESTATTGGGDFEEPIPSLSGHLSDPGCKRTTLSTPPPGKYRLFVYALNEQGQVAHGNIPFLVEGEISAPPHTVF